MAAGALDRLLTTLAIRLHACSVCQIQHGWGLAYSPFDAIMIRFVLSGTGTSRVGTGPVLQCCRSAPGRRRVPGRNLVLLMPGAMLARLLAAAPHVAGSPIRTAKPVSVDA